MTTVYLARHGRTTWNKEEIFRGRADVPLDDLGRRQAHALGTALRRLPIGLVVASPLARARETAEIALEQLPHFVLRLDPAFTDLDFGDWEGLARPEVAKRYPELYQQWVTDPGGVRFPGGESLADVEERAWPALCTLVQSYPGESILVVTHRVVCKVILARALGVGSAAFWRIRQDTACLNALAWGEQGFEVVLMNDTCHLRVLSTPDASDF